jgi:hypothetical protein
MPQKSSNLYNLDSMLWFLIQVDWNHGQQKYSIFTLLLFTIFALIGPLNIIIIIIIIIIVLFSPELACNLSLTLCCVCP